MKKTLVIIVKKFYECLSEENYDKWITFIKTLDKEIYQEVISIFEKINDYIANKIASTEQNLLLRISEHEKMEKRLREENKNLVKKNTEAENKLQLIENNRKEGEKEESKQKTILQSKD